MKLYFSISKAANRQYKRPKVNCKRRLSDTYMCCLRVSRGALALNVAYTDKTEGSAETTEPSILP